MRFRFKLPKTRQADGDVRRVSTDSKQVTEAPHRFASQTVDMLENSIEQQTSYFSDYF